MKGKSTVLENKQTNKKKTESTICPKQITLIVFLFFYSSQGSYAASCMESQL